MSVFNLKFRDTKPVLEVALLNPDGSAHDLTGATGVTLHIRLSSGVRLARPMSITDIVGGIVQYAWTAADWGTGTTADLDGSYTVGGLIAGPALPLAPGKSEHTMEYEVIGPGGARLSFPNGGVVPAEAYDTLRVWSDIGQA